MKTSIVGDFDDECFSLSLKYSDDGTYSCSVQFTNNPTAYSKEILDKFSIIMGQFWDLNPGINSIIIEDTSPTFTNATKIKDINEIEYGDYIGRSKGIWTLSCEQFQLDNRHDGFETLSYDVKRYMGASRFKKINLRSIVLITRLLSNQYINDSFSVVFGSDIRLLIDRDGISAI